MRKINYNIKSSKDLGWTPEWFGEEEFGDSLVEKIFDFQKKNGLYADGLCGQATFRALYSERLEDGAERFENSGTKRPLILNGYEIDIEWDKVIRWIDDDGLKLSSEPRLDLSRDATMFVTHWDVCLNSKMCVDVLNNRSLSVHFCIDNDGTIYQLADINAVCYHAGSRMWNDKSIGVEISNAFYLRRQKYYVNNGFGERPIESGKHVHGSKVEDHLGFYPVQIDALKALYMAIHKALGVPLSTPLDSEGRTLYSVSEEAESGTFNGFISHYHLTRRKTDCCSLDIESILKELR